MRNIKTILITTLIMALLLSLSGCNETQNEEACLEPIRIENINGGSGKEEIIKEINKARNMTEEEHNNYGNYRSWKVPEIEEFYSLDNLEIDGYELQEVSIVTGTICFVFGLIEDEFKDDSHIGSSTIEIGIGRTDWEYSSTFLEDVVTQTKEQGSDYLLKDNMLYTKDSYRLEAQFNDTFFIIQAPVGFSQKVIDEFVKSKDQYGEDEFQDVLDYIDESNREAEELNNYEFLRDLAFKVMESAELVKV